MSATDWIEQLRKYIESSWNMLWCQLWWQVEFNYNSFVFLCLGIPRMRTTDKSAVPSSPTSVSSSFCKSPQRAASSKLPVKGLPTSPSSSSLGSTISESNSIAVNKGVCLCRVSSGHMHLDRFQVHTWKLLSAKIHAFSHCI